jgi:hypothetical protein
MQEKGSENCYTETLYTFQWYWCIYKSYFLSGNKSHTMPGTVLNNILVKSNCTTYVYQLITVVSKPTTLLLYINLASFSFIKAKLSKKYL